MNEITDKERMDFLEEHIHHISHDRAVCSVDMSGKMLRASFEYLPRGRYRSIREACDEAIKQFNQMNETIQRV